ncbi:MAG: hypothetical protein ACI87W_001428 [Halieaceae bacterium]|jgi:hypothetical protein
MPIPGLILSWLWLGALAFLSARLAQQSLLSVLALGLLATAPLLFFTLYSDTVKKTARAIHFLPGSRLAMLFRSRTVSSVLIVFLSLLGGQVIVFWLAGHSDQERVLVLCAPILLMLSVGAMSRLLQSEYREYLEKLITLRAAAYLAAFLLALLHALTVFLLSDGGGYASADMIVANLDQPIAGENHPLVALATRLTAYAFSFKASLGARAADLLGISLWQAQLLSSLLYALSALLLMGALSAFFIPRAEYRRLLQPVDGTAGQTETRASTVILGTALGVLIVLMVWPRLLVDLDQRLKAPALSEKVSQAEQAALPVAYLIEGKACPQQVARDINQAATQLLRESMDARQGIREQVDAAYGVAAANLENYLDYYYSLPAEYLRIGAALTGSLESRISGELQDYLLQGDPFAGVQGELLAVLNADQRRADDYKALVYSLIEKNCEAATAGDFQLLGDYSLNQLLQPIGDIETGNLELRLGASGVAAVSGVVAAKVVAKTVSRGAVGLAAKAVAKVGAKKVAATAVGSTIGAVLGSVIPGAGTLAGAGIGAVLGAAIGVSVDALLLELEEVYAREDFARQIAQSLAESRTETLTVLGLHTVPGPAPELL